MSIPTESTPLLLPPNGNGKRRLPASRHQPWPRRTEADLQSYVQQVISSLRNDPTGPLPEVTTQDAELTILLYTLIFLSTSPWSAEYDEIVAQVGHERIDAKVGDRIKDEVGKLLDKGGSREVGHVNNARLRRILWDKWEVEPGIWVSSMDLLISPDMVSCDFMSHPLITHFAHHVYYHGPSFTSRTKTGVLRGLETSITPRGANILHFVSLIILWTLTILIALQPDRSRTFEPSINGLEIGWIIFAFGHVVQALQHPLSTAKTIALLPTVVALLTYPFSSCRPYTSTFQQLSIPFLTVSILLPTPASLPSLFPSLLPTSVRLFGIVKAGFSGWLLICPILLLFFGLLSFSLNGDIYRGFFVDPSPFSHVHLNVNTNHLDRSTTEPAEDGVAPYETRVAIFGTIILLLYFAICLSIAGMARARHGERRLPSARGGSIDWENRHGAELARRSRAKLVIGIRWLMGDLGRDTIQDRAGMRDAEIGPTESDDVVLRPKPDSVSPPVPVPLNLLLLPLDMAIIVSRLAAWMVGGTTGDVIHRLGDMRYWTSIIFLGLPCGSLGWCRLPARHFRGS